MAVGLHKVSSLPDTPDADSFYYVKGSESDVAEAWLTDSDGSPVKIVFNGYDDLAPTVVTGARYSFTAFAPLQRDGMGTASGLLMIDDAGRARLLREAPSGDALRFQIELALDESFATTIFDADTADGDSVWRYEEGGVWTTMSSEGLDRDLTGCAVAVELPALSRGTRYSVRRRAGDGSTWSSWRGGLILI